MHHRGFVVLIIVLLCLVLSGQVVSSQNDLDEKLFIPLVSKHTAPPERLGPYVAPGALSFAIHPSNPSIVYAGTNGGGVFKSWDSGENWIPASQGLPTTPQIFSLVVDPANPNRLYAGLYYNYVSDWQSGVYRSEDGGETWIPTGRMDNPSAGIYANHVVVYRLVISSDGGVLYAATRTKIDSPPKTYGEGGVFKSVDHGASWSLVNNGLPVDDLYVYDLALHPINPNYIYAALHGSGVYRSTNGGASWAWANTDIPDFVVKTTANRTICMDKTNPAQLLFGTVERLTYKTTNSAGNWNSVSLSNLFMLQGASDRAYAVYATTLTGALFYSANFGGSWSARASTATNGFIYVDPTSYTRLFAGGVSGASSTRKSVDGGMSFVDVMKGISGYAVTGLVASPADSNRLYASLFGWGVMTSNNGGANWLQTNSGLPSTNVLGLTMDPNNANRLYALTDAAGVYGVYTSANGGSTWSGLNSGYPQLRLDLNRMDLPFVEAAPLDPLDGSLEPETAPILTATGSAPGLSIAVSPFSSSVVLLGTSGSGLVRLNGSTWVETNVTSGDVDAILFDRGTAGQVWLGGSAGVHRSTNNGETWLSSGLSGIFVYALAQGTSNDNVLMAGTDSGVYLSTDRGNTWMPAGLSGAVKAVAVHPTISNLLLAATAESVFFSPDNGATWNVIDHQIDQFDYLGVSVSPMTPGMFLFYSRYGGIVRVYQ